MQIPGLHMLRVSADSAGDLLQKVLCAVVDVSRAASETGQTISISVGVVRTHSG